MSHSVSPRLLFNWLSPMVLAVVSFLLVRIVIDEDYLAHSIMFIVVELAMAVGMSYLLCFLMSRWAQVVMKRGIPVLLAYLCPVLWASAIVLAMILVSHSISYMVDNVPFSMGDLEVPIVIVALVTVWLYAHYESMLMEQRYEEMRLKNERISDEMRYYRDALNRVDPNEGNDVRKADSVIALKADRVIHRVEVNDIILVEGMENYLKVYTGDGVIITRSSMKGLLERLPDKIFMQVHRSYIVNLSHVISIEGNTIQLRHDYCAPVSRSTKARLRDIFTNSH